MPHLLCWRSRCSGVSVCLPSGTLQLNCTICTSRDCKSGCMRSGACQSKLYQFVCEVPRLALQSFALRQTAHGSFRKSSADSSLLGVQTRSRVYRHALGCTDTLLGAQTRSWVYISAALDDVSERHLLRRSRGCPHARIPRCCVPAAQRLPPHQAAGHCRVHSWVCTCCHQSRLHAAHEAGSCCFLFPACDAAHARCVHDSCERLTYIAANLCTSAWDGGLHGQGTGAWAGRND